MLEVLMLYRTMDRHHIIIIILSDFSLSFSFKKLLNQFNNIFFNVLNYIMSFCDCSCSTVKWNLNDRSKHYILNLLENIVTALVFIIVVINVFITAFGVQRAEDTKT